jgi:Icc-related predicted phosphoesterase
MKIIFATDLHGNAALYEKLLREAERKDIEAVLIGGDITPYEGFGINNMRVQRSFLGEYLVPKLGRFAIKVGKPVLIMMGNDDFGLNFDLLEKAESDGRLRIMHDRVLQLGKFNVAGYSFIAPTPFLIKDWEKSEDEIASDLRKLSGKTDLARTAFVFHTPPANTDLDVLYNGVHAGSVSVLGFIKRKQPMLTLHGHIHESPDVSGKWKQKIGRTLSINPGNSAFVVVDLSNPENSVRKKY